MQTPAFDVTDAISYNRFSSGRQAKGNSVARQTDMGEEYATRHGLRIMDTYLDAGVSAYDGTNGDTGALRHLLDAAKAGRFKRGTPLLIESLDRLSRRAAWRAQRLLTELIEAGLVVVTLVDELVYSEQSLDEDPMRFMMSIAIMIRSNDESKNKSKRSLDNRARERERARTLGIPVTARTHAWIKVVGEDVSRNFALDAVHTGTVRRAFELAEIGYGAMKIAAILNQEDRRTFGSGARWYAGSVLDVLNNDAVIGMFQPHRYVKLAGGMRKREPVGDPFKYFPAAVDPAVFMRVREGLKSRRQAHGRNGPQHANLVKGLSRCEVCDGRVHHFERVRGYPYLRCYNATGVRACSNHTGFPYKQLERLLYKLYETHVAISDLLPKAPDDNANCLAELEAARDRAVERIDALIDDLESRQPGPAKEAVQRRLDQREAELTAIQRDIHEVRQKARVAESLADQDFEARFNAARAKIESNDPNECKEARIQVAQEYRRIIDHLVLCQNRTMVVHMRERDGATVAYRLSPGCVIGAEITTHGWTAIVGPKGLEKVSRNLAAVRSASDVITGIRAAIEAVEDRIAEAFDPQTGDYAIKPAPMDGSNKTPPGGRLVTDDATGRYIESPDMVSPDVPDTPINRVGGHRSDARILYLHGDRARK